MRSTLACTRRCDHLREGVALVQLGGLEPPTSCSTDRRSNQLSYNCILMPAPEKGSPNGAETRCNARLWQGRAGHHKRHRCAFIGIKNKKPGLAARAFLEREALLDQAAGLNSFDALALIGSAASVATFWASSASSLLWAVKVSNCFLA